MIVEEPNLDFLCQTAFMKYLLYLLLVGLTTQHRAANTAQGSQHSTGQPTQQSAANATQGSQHSTGQPTQHRAADTAQGSQYGTGQSIRHRAANTAHEKGQVHSPLAGTPAEPIPKQRRGSAQWWGLQLGRTQGMHMARTQQECTWG